MAKNLNIKQWISIIETYHKYGIRGAVKKYVKYKPSSINSTNLVRIIKDKINLVDNMGMEILNQKPGTGFKATGRPKNRNDSDIPSIIDKLNDEQKCEIIKHWIKEQRNKEDKNSLDKFKTLNKSEKALILNFHRTS